MITPETRFDQERGCGWRKPGGLYLVAPSLGKPCGKLPMPMEVCPCCGQGVKPARGFTWVDPGKLFERQKCLSKDGCLGCSLSMDALGHIAMGKQAGLLWIGEKYYPTAQEWIQESATQGISRRLSRIPRGFKVGIHWILVGHRKGIQNLDGSWTPAIFQAFRPKAIEYVVKGDETQEELEALVKRGITPVAVKKAQQEIFETETETKEEK